MKLPDIIFGIGNYTMYGVLVFIGSDTRGWFIVANYQSKGYISLLSGNGVHNVPIADPRALYKIRHVMLDEPYTFSNLRHVALFNEPARTMLRNSEPW